MFSNLNFFFNKSHPFWLQDVRIVDHILFNVFSPNLRPTHSENKNPEFNVNASALHTRNVQFLFT